MPGSNKELEHKGNRNETGSNTVISDCSAGRWFAGRMHGRDCGRCRAGSEQFAGSAGKLPPCIIRQARRQRTVLFHHIGRFKRWLRSRERNLGCSRPLLTAQVAADAHRSPFGQRCCRCRRNGSLLPRTAQKDRGSQVRFTEMMKAPAALQPTGKRDTTIPTTSACSRRV